MQLLSLLLETKIRIKQILPNDSVRLADEYTLLITDIVIETEDGRIANLEIQKIGYAFPGQRTVCYSEAVQEGEGQETERKQKV